MSKPPRLLVFQHIALEHPGIFRDFLAEDGIEWDAVELDEGEAISDLGAYDGLWVMGGPMDVWEEEAHPWFVAQKAAIHEAVRDRGLPFFGLCLGHQLLADSLGGRVGKAATPEGERQRSWSAVRLSSQTASMGAQRAKAARADRAPPKAMAAPAPVAYFKS